MKVKLISIAAIILAGVIVAITTISAAVSKNNEYNGYLASARANAENQVPYTACQKYRQAFAIKCEDESIYKEYLEQAKLIDESFYDSAVKSYVTYFPESPTAYEELCTFYYNSESYKNVIKTAKTANELGIATEKVRDYYLECFYMYKYMKTGFEEATSFLGDYAMVKKDGLYGYISTTGGFVIRPTYKDANVFLGTSTAVNDGKEWYMINTSGYKIARPSQAVEDLSFVSNNKIRVAQKGKYGYTNSNFDIAEKLPYDYASNFKNGVAAVKIGDKWGLIDSNEKQITDCIFEDILLDEYETCINNGVIFAKKDGKYYMVNEKGSKISDQGFDKAYPFMSSEPAAVCIDKKWGFVDASGKIVIEPTYTEAKSFSNGLAPVSTDGMWGYININNEYRIESKFTDCLPFSTTGIAAVKENDVWNYIKLLAYYD